MLGTLIAWRLRWWGTVTSRAVLRHWQWFVLAGVLVPMDTRLGGLLLAVASPILTAFQAGHDLPWHLLRLAGFQLVAALWILVQRPALAGGPFRRYIETQPLTTSTRRLVDVAVLVPANTVLVTPVVASLLLTSTGTVPDRAEVFASITVLAALILVLQLALLEGRAWAVLPILVANVALSGAQDADAPITRGLLLLGAVLLGLAALSHEPGMARFGRSRLHGQRAWLHRLPPDVRVQWKALAAQPATLLRVALLLGIAIGTDALSVAFNFDRRSLPTVALALAALALVTAGAYRTLRDAHAAIGGYLASLPLARGFWPQRDIRFLVVAGTLPALAVLLPPLLHSPHRIPTAALLLLGYWGLLIALRWPVLRGGRQSALIGVVMAGVWSAAAMAATR